MTTLMLRLELGRSNARLLQIAGDLAQTLSASLIGFAACQPLRVIYGDGYMSGDVIQQDRDEIDKEIKAAEAEFRSLLKDRLKDLEWRSGVTYADLADYLAHQARNADLIITGVDRSGSLFDSSRHVNVGDLVMQAGRPVLIVPASAGELKLNHILVGWKETREARRAAFDALPLLKKAGRVTIVEIAAEPALAAARSHLADVAGWLKRHGVGAESIAAGSVGDDATRLSQIATEQQADLIVAGAYGHSRVREWALGGVTQDLLLCADRCSLVSH